MGSLAMPYKEIGGPSSVRQAADCIIINYGILLGLVKPAYHWKL